MNISIIGTYTKENKKNIKHYTIKLISSNTYQIRIDLIAKNGQSTNTVLKNYNDTFKLLERNNLIDGEGGRI